MPRLPEPGDARALELRGPVGGAPGSEEERLAVFRRVRDAIAARLRGWLAERRPA